MKIKIYKTVILKEEFRLRLFEKRMLRRIFEPKRDENGQWRGLHNEKIHGFYRSPNTVRVIKSTKFRWAGHVARMEEGRRAFKILTYNWVKCDVVKTIIHI